MLTDEEQREDREILTNTLREALIEANIAVKKYYCHCGGRMGFYPAKDGKEAYYRCISCGHTIAAEYIDRNRRIKAKVELVKKGEINDN